MAKAKKLTVKELKELAPLSEVYELSPYCKYLVFIPVSSLVGGAELAKSKAIQAAKAFQYHNIPGAVLFGKIEDMQIMELKVEKE